MKTIEITSLGESKREGEGIKCGKKEHKNKIGEEKVKEKKDKQYSDEKTGRGKQRMQMREESITKMIAAITIIISMCCWQ